MRLVVSIALVLALLASSAALAARGDPQKKFTAADQGRAKAMLVRKADLPAGYSAAPRSSDPDAYCKADDESDLTLTGEAESGFVRTSAVLVASGAQIYGTVAEANASWRRATSPGGRKCLKDEVRRTLLMLGVRDIQSPPPFTFPRLAQRMFAFRVAGFVQGVPLFFDLLALQQSRAQVVLWFESVLQPVLRPEQTRIARLVADRMAKAMRAA
jgi:hypothetical protein